MKFSILFPYLFLFSLSLSAQKKADIHPIYKQHAECIEKDGSNLGMRQCTIESIDAWDKELNKVYKNLMDNLNEADQAALKKSQRKWIEFRDAEFEFLDSFIASRDGSMYITYYAMQKMAFIRARTAELYNHSLSAEY